MNAATSIRTEKPGSRLDQALVDRQLLPTRGQAQGAILAGQILINGQPARKAGEKVRASDVLEVLQGPKYVSRGGLKLEHALQDFHLHVKGMRALDLGASTGGFTDCLLQAGAESVCAVDVGQGQLAWKLRQDPRVDVRERKNARYLKPSDFGSDFQPFDLVVIDCSFISLQRILPPIPLLLRTGGDGIALIKPQFEAGKTEVDRGSGVIRDAGIHDRILEELQNFMAHHLPSLEWKQTVPSPLLGPAGNKEFLVHFKQNRVCL